MKKRILSILLALCMVLCLVPTTAFAEGETNRKVETEQELVDALADSSADIITLKNDIAIGTTLTVLRKVTLDLNGYVLKMTGSGSVIILDKKSGITGDLNLIDSNHKAENKFKVNGAEPWVLDNSGKETVYGGIITGGPGRRPLPSPGAAAGGPISPAWRVEVGEDGREVRSGSVRYLLEPRVVDEDFCRRLAACPNFCPQFHLRLQSGSDGVLRRLHRHYDTAR